MSRVGVSEGNFGIISRVSVKLVRLCDCLLARVDEAGSVSAWADFRVVLGGKAETRGVLGPGLENPGTWRIVPRNFLARSRRTGAIEEPAYRTNIEGVRSIKSSVLQTWSLSVSKVRRVLIVCVDKEPWCGLRSCSSKRWELAMRTSVSRGCEDECAWAASIEGATQEEEDCGVAATSVFVASPVSNERFSESSSVESP